MKVKALVTQSCLTLCDPMDYNLPGSSVHGISQGRILEWVAISFSRGSSQPGDRTHSYIGRGILYHRAIREAHMCHWSFVQKPMEGTPPTGTVNSGCWVMGSQCKNISYNKLNTLAVDVDSGGGAGCAGAAGIWEFSAPSFQFYYEPETALKNKMYFLKNKAAPTWNVAITNPS